MGDEELAGFHAGDEATFRRLVDEHSPRLLAIARPFASGGDAAHDLVQETWVRAYQRRETYLGRGPILGWLCAICRNVCLSETRRASGREVREASVAERSLGALEGSPDERAERNEARRRLFRALLELPERQRSVVVLRMLEGRSTRECAAALECAEGTVKASLHHALKNLARSLRAEARKPDAVGSKQAAAGSRQAADAPGGSEPR